MQSNIKLKYFYFLIFVLNFNLLNAQFELLGDAHKLEGRCYSLTVDSILQIGGILSKNKINLNNPFSFTTSIFLGDKEEGGAGIAFVLQSNNSSLGTENNSIGVSSNGPSLIVEIDTYENGDLNDPFSDHIAVMKDGILDHGSLNNLQGPISIQGNIKDGQWHTLRIEWDPITMILTAAIDCQELISYNIDIASDIFSGDPIVNYGFTSSNDGQLNRHELCFDLIRFRDQLRDVTICKGAKTQLNTFNNAQSYKWIPSNGLNRDDIANPIANPTETTEYSVEIETGYCNEVINFSALVTVDDTEANLDIGPNRSICYFEELILDATTENATAYKWSTGVSTPTLEVTSTRRYDVTVTIDNSCKIEDWASITIVDPPNFAFGLDTTICNESVGFFLKPIVDEEVSYFWQNGSTADSLFISRPGYYNLRIENQCGSDEDDVFVFSESCRDFYMPNAFTPNNDGFNDLIYPFTEPGDLKSIAIFEIYDRWGSIVHSIKDGQPNSPSIGWDGKVNGKLMQPGTFMYQIIFEFRDGEKSLVKGNFSLF